MLTILAQLRHFSVRTIACVLPMLALAACGGGGSNDGNGGNGGGNTAPTASAGPDQSVLENTTVNLNGSGSDPDTGDTLSFSWTQISGATVTIDNANMASASFTAPDVTLGLPETLMMQLTVSDGTVSRSDSVDVVVQEPQPTVTVSGVVRYEFVPPNFTGQPNDCIGLDFNSIITRSIRGATVQLIDAGSGNVLQSTTASDIGGYSFANVIANSMVRLRVRAELKRNGTPSWDVEVRDNVDLSPNPPSLTNRALYVLDGAPFDTGSVDVVRPPMLAATGWDGTSYSSPRAAAPFSILDTIYEGIQLILSVNPTANFPGMDAFWSVNNTLVLSGAFPDIDSGELGASFYSSNPDFLTDPSPNPSLFLLGDAATDTEEFDDHVILHEWGHYFEDNFSRSDSIGGPHAIGESLIPTLAFSEGWATAFAAIALDDPIYCDSGIVGSVSGFGLNTEEDGFGVAGWFNEFDITTLIYDLWDTDNDGTDTDSIGFGPIYDTMTGPQVVTPAATSVFTFAAELRSMLNPQQQLFLDSQLTRQFINPTGIDIWGITETNDGSGSPDSDGRDVLPLYTDISADGSVTNICVNSDFDKRTDGNGDRLRDGNKLAEFRGIRLTVPTTDTYDVLIVSTTATPATPDPNDRDQSDPDMEIFLTGVPVLPWPLGLSGAENSERFITPTLVAGLTYVATVHDFRFADFAGTPQDYPEQICFDVSFTATP